MSQQFDAINVTASNKPMQILKAHLLNGHAAHYTLKDDDDSNE
jgi:hypothetical protein